MKKRKKGKIESGKYRVKGVRSRIDGRKETKRNRTRREEERKKETKKKRRI